MLTSSRSNGFLSSGFLPSSVEESTFSHDESGYNELCKEILSSREFIVPVLAEAVEEFHGMSEEEIWNSLRKLEDSDLDEASRARTEVRDSHGNKRTVVYDLRYIVGKEGNIELFINLEGQKDADFIRRQVMRGIVYLSHLIVSQQGTVFSPPEYEKLSKSYSIWVMKDVPEKYRNKAFRIRLVATHFDGSPANELDGSFYDAEELIIFCLGEYHHGMDTGIDKALGILDLCFGGLDNDERDNILRKEYGIIPKENVRRRMERMCNFSYGIKKAGIEQGRIQNIVDNIRVIMQKLGQTAEEAMDFLEVPKDDRAKCLELMNS